MLIDGGERSVRGVRPLDRGVERIADPGAADYESTTVGGAGVEGEIIGHYSADMVERDLATTGYTIKFINATDHPTGASTSFDRWVS